MKGAFMRKLVLVGVLVGAGGFLFAEGSRTPVDSSTPDALLAEVRALRAEITQVASAGVRTQLLVARLQLQEQRVLSVGRQLADAQNALAAVQGRISGERVRIRQLEDAASRATAQGRAAYQQAIVDAGNQIEQQQREELQLQAREKELQKTVNEEQLRWSDFNDRLDALERSLPANVSH
jgi:predicted nuclease with TOPRIM domain